MIDHARMVTQLETVLADGKLTIESEGERVTFRSTDDLIKSIAYHRARAAEGSGMRSSGSTLAVFEYD